MFLRVYIKKNFLLFFKDEKSNCYYIKEGVWRSFKENLKVFYKFRNIFILGSYGVGKLLFINIVIIVLIGEYRLYVDIGCGLRYNIIRLYR